MPWPKIVFESIKRGLEQALEHASGNEGIAIIHRIEPVAPVKTGYPKPRQSIRLYRFFFSSYQILPKICF
jgi:hypothetical protein